MPKGVRPFLDPVGFLVIVSEIAVRNKIKHRARDVQTARCVPPPFWGSNPEDECIRKPERRISQTTGSQVECKIRRYPDESGFVTDRDPTKTYILNRL